MKLPIIKKEEWLFFAAVTTITIFIFSKISNERKQKVPSIKIDKTKNYILGDSQVPFIDLNSNKASVIGKKGNQGAEEFLWLGGKNLKWLKNAIAKYPISPDVNSITVSIGTNGGFNTNDDVLGLTNLIKQKFPNAQLYAVQGSWNWGGNKNVTEQQVRSYYKKYNDLGFNLIEPPIGPIEPHGNHLIYKEIGKVLDEKIN